MAAECTSTASTKPSVSTSRWRLRPEIFFSRVVPAYAASVGGLHRLTIEDGGTRLRLAALECAKRPPQDLVHTLPRAVEAPTPIVAVYRFPGREIVRHHAPGAAAT